jgi:hypothetical protein
MSLNGKLAFVETKHGVVAMDKGRIDPYSITGSSEYLRTGRLRQVGGTVKSVYTNSKAKNKKEAASFETASLCLC